MDASTSPGSPDSAPSGPPLREALALGAIGLVVLAALVCWVVWSPAPRKGATISPSLSGEPIPDGPYVGARVCGECHPTEYAVYTSSGHARTLRPAGARALARVLDGRDVADPERPGVMWSYAVRDGRLTADRAEQGDVRRFLLEYAFGSGHHATTFVTVTEPDPVRPTLLEHRLTYFASDRSLDMTPGQSAVSRLVPPAPAPVPGTTPVGRVVTGSDALKCFRCHTTRTSAQVPEELDTATMIPNVSCERCHGPGRDHVASVRAGKAAPTMAFGPGSWTADGELRLCGQCHRHPERSRRELIRTDNLGMVRFQPIGLMQSGCYKQSQGTLACSTCHDPHARPSADLASYEPICLDCHRTVSRRPECPVSPRSGCVGCHMPRRDSGQRVLYTDHWIRVHRDRPAGRGTRHESPEARRTDRDPHERPLSNSAG